MQTSNLKCIIRDDIGSVKNSDVYFLAIYPIFCHAAIITFMFASVILTIRFEDFWFPEAWNFNNDEICIMTPKNSVNLSPNSFKVVN